MGFFNVFFVVAAQSMNHLIGAHSRNGTNRDQSRTFLMSFSSGNATIPETFEDNEKRQEMTGRVIMKNPNG